LFKGGFILGLQNYGRYKQVVVIWRWSLGKI
jgi:hypothetical protein